MPESGNLTAGLAAAGVIREAAKRSAAALAGLAPQARYRRAILVLSHMRSATTALSNVLCSHPAISGYGETHVRHATAQAPGRVVVNLALRSAFRPGAPFILDKILHDDLDRAAPEAFFRARAIFLLRQPEPTIRSILELARRKAMPRYSEPMGAAQYYAERVESLAGLWDRFPEGARFGVLAEDLLAAPDPVVSHLGDWLGLSPRLENRYISHRATQIGGGGDPLRSAGLDRIEPRAVPERIGPVEGLSEPLAARCAAAHQALAGRFRIDG